MAMASVAKRLKRPRASTPSATIIVSPEHTLSAFDEDHHDWGSHDDGDVDGDGDVARKLNGPILWACHRTGLRCEGEIHSSDVRSASSGRSALCLAPLLEAFNQTGSPASSSAITVSPIFLSITS